MVTMWLLQFQSSHPFSRQEEGERVMLSTFPNTYHPADFPLFYGLELGHMVTVKARILKNKKQGCHN